MRRAVDRRRPAWPPHPAGHPSTTDLPGVDHHAMPFFTDLEPQLLEAFDRVHADDQRSR